MENYYKNYLDAFFYRILDIRHSISRITTVLKSDVERLMKSDIKFIAGSALVISDWTGPTDDGWEINFHTGISKTTLKESYKEEVERIISSKCCLSYAQAFEALEKFFKDCIYHKISNDSNLRESLGFGKEFNRGIMPGGESLFKLLKKAGGKKLIESSKSNNKNLRFKELWSVLSETRHAITHSNSHIRPEKISKTKYHLAVFNYLFNYSVGDNSNWLIELDYKMLDNLLKHVAEFGYQVFKILNETEIVVSEN